MIINVAACGKDTFENECTITNIRMTGKRVFRASKGRLCGDQEIFLFTK